MLKLVKYQCRILVAALIVALPTTIVSASNQTGINLSVSTVNLIENLDVPTEPTLQEWFELNGFAINATADELGVETFDAGCYQISILAEMADFASYNNLSWYSAETGIVHLIFSGGDGTGDTVSFHASETFGLCLGTPDGELHNESDPQIFYTETSRNADGFDHALIYANPNPWGGYIIAWEDLRSGGDRDFQDMILAMLTPIIKARVSLTPRVLNLRSRGRWITGFIVLPPEAHVENVIVSTIQLNNSIPAQLKPVTSRVYKRLGLEILSVKFDRASVINLIRNAISSIENPLRRQRIALTISGTLIDGLAFEGETEIRIIHFPGQRTHVCGIQDRAVNCRRL
ncbi:MAG: DUF4114 domain-containing protein [Candidatus Bathyarchaeota archaeon]|nr:DUF4114 domain-containing protein [Candidatus Bathyarchaeota archaeon]